MQSQYSRLLGWEVWNFMGFIHARVSFDERNILNFKGYNDSGKSAMCVALSVLMTNASQTKQVDFIHDDCDYFRVVAYFDDGVKILRDKYINGQSLYEMYKGDELVFTTKNGKALTRVSDVPQPIKDYLGLISYGNTYLNVRSCIDKQFGAQTTGSENYLAFNTVLKAEELASANAMLNNDKNRLVADLSSLENEVYVTRQMCQDGSQITDEVADALSALDSYLDSLEERNKAVTSMVEAKTLADEIPYYPEVKLVNTERLDDVIYVSTIKDALDNVEIFPEVKLIDTSRLDDLSNLVRCSEDLKELPCIPEIKLLDVSKLDEISTLWGISQQLGGLAIAPIVEELDMSKLEAVCNLYNIIEEISACTEKDNQIALLLSEVDKSLNDLNSDLAQLGVKMVKCPNCGQVFDSDTTCC